MTETGFHYDIGKYKCTIFSDGTWRKPDSEDEEGGFNCLLIDTGDHKVLIDTGGGEGFETTAGLLVKNMQYNELDRSNNHEPEQGFHH